MISKEGKKIWQSKAGGNLMAAMLGTKPLTRMDELTIKRLKVIDQDGQDTDLAQRRQSETTPSAATPAKS